MNRSNYSFLDYTVMPFLRKRLISAEAAVLFSDKFDKILWANAVGTRLFGGSTVIDLMEAGLSQSHPLIRQLVNAAKQIDDDEVIYRSFQISRGLKTETIRSEISLIELPDGGRVALLACPQDDIKHRYREHELAKMSVESLDGFADAAAIIDEYGLILASSQQFDAFEIDPQTLETLVSMVAREDDRLVKRPIESRGGETVAAGLGRIRDLPARFLVVLASSEEDVEAITVEPTARQNLQLDTEDYNQQADAGSGVLASSLADVGVFEDEAPDKPPPWQEDMNKDEAGQPLVAEEPGDAIADKVVEKPSIRIPAPPRPPEPRRPTASSDIEKTDADSGTDEPTGTKGSLLDRWYFSDGKSEQSADESTSDTDAEVDVKSEDEEAARTVAPLTETVTAPLNPPVTAPVTAPARFAFTIDSDRIVRSVSPELVEAVGSKSGNIVERSWQEIASLRRFDEDGVINALLAKADTWSNKSVLWPVDGTDMAVPIDLAALPVFDKERRFDGFRGFGIIRSADAVVDPKGTGFAIALASEESAQRVVGDELDEVDEDETGRNGGWRTNLKDEDGEDPAETNIVTKEDASTYTSVEDPVGEKEADVLEQSDSASRKAKGNIFHLPNFRTFGKRRQSDVSDEAPLERNAMRSGEQSGDEDPVPELNGSEKRAFSEIKKSLSEDVLEADGAQAGQGAETGTDSLLASLPFPLLIYQTARTLFANDALLEETGYETLDELAAAGGIDALLETDDEEAGSSVTRKDGSRVPVKSRLTKVDWQGQPALCLTFETAARDTRDGFTGNQKTALDMARVSELENILETAADGLVVIDEEGWIDSLNSSGEALFGVEQSDVTGKKFTTLFAAESRSVLEKHLEELKAPGVSSVLNQGQEVIGIEANGGLIPLFAMIGKVGSSGRYCAVLRDLTDWKKTEEELVEARRKAETANDQKSEFLARVSHEIREPLTSIIGFSDVMIEERFGRIENERYREYLKDINRSGIHVLDLVNDLLDISKIEAGKLELSYEAVDLNQLAAETVALLQPKANHKRIIIRTSLSRAVPKVVADARSVRQIILNLVSNAIQHSHRNSQVIVSTTYEENGEVALRIRDTGNGMSESELQRALEPFAQVGDDRLTAPGGTGLGLPLTKALVEANRAYFDLESTKGEGTIAHIQFPSQRVLAD